MTEIRTWDIVSAMGSVGVVWNVTCCKVIHDCFIRGTCLRDLCEQKEVQDGSEGIPTWANGLPK